MAIGAETPFIILIGTGEATDFDHAPTFTLSDPSHLTVSLDGSPTTNYVKTSTGVRFPSPIPLGTQVTLRRQTPVDQPVPSAGLRTFDLQVVEKSLDRTTRQTQELAEQVSRTPKADLGHLPPGGSFHAAPLTTLGQDGQGKLIHRTPAQEVAHLGVTQLLSQAQATADQALAQANATATSEANALTSATTATTKASEAAASAAAALLSRNQGLAALSGTETLANDAAASAVTASSHKDAAAASAIDADNFSRASAAASAAAQTSRNRAQTSEANALASATTAATHKDTAYTYKQAAQLSASAAEFQANRAADRATAAGDAATAAATSQTNATAYAADAMTSSLSAATSATTATNKASEAAASAASIIAYPPPPSPSLGDLHALNQGGTAWMGLNQGQQFSISSPMEYVHKPFPPNFKRLTTYRLSQGYADSGYTIADLILQMMDHHGSQWVDLVTSETPFGSAGHQFQIVNSSPYPVIIGVGYAVPYIYTTWDTMETPRERLLAPYGAATVSFFYNNALAVTGDIFTDGSSPILGPDYGYGSY